MSKARRGSRKEQRPRAGYGGERPAGRRERIGWSVAALLVPVFAYGALPRFADHGQLTFPLAAVLFTWVPGHLLSRHIPSWHALDRPLAHGVSAMLGIGLLGSTGILVKLLHLPMGMAGWAVSGVAFIAALRGPSTLRRSSTATPPHPPTIEGKNHPTYLIAALALSAVMTLVRPVFHENPVSPGEVRDEWLYAAFLHRSVSQPAEVLPIVEAVPSIGLPTRIVINGWNQMQASLSATTDVSPALITFSGLQPLVILLSLWSTYALARVLLMRRDLALIAVAFFALYHLSRIAEFPRSALLWQQDKYVSVLALVNFVLAVGTVYLRRPSIDLLLTLVALLWTVTITHVFGLAASAVGLGAIWLGASGRRALGSAALRQVPRLAAAALPAVVFALWHRAEIPSWVFTLSTEIPRVATRHYVEHDWGWTLSPRFIGDLSTQVAIGVCMLAGAVAWRGLAGRYAAIFTSFVLVLTLTPVTALAVRVISTVQLVRFYWILPIGLAVAALVGTARHYSPESGWRRHLPQALMLILLAGGIATTLSHGVAGEVLAWSEQSSTRMRDTDRWLVEILTATEEERPLIVTGDARSRMLAFGLTDARIISYYEGFWGPQAKARSRAFNADATLTPRDLEFLSGMPIDESTRRLYPQLDLPDYIRYEADYVVLRTGHPLLPTLRAHPERFPHHASNQEYTVFRAPGHQSNRLFLLERQKALARAALVEERLDVAERLYAKLVIDHPDDPASHLGAAATTSRSGRPCLARVQMARMLSHLRADGGRLATATYVKKFFAPLDYDLADLGLDLGVPLPRCFQVYARVPDDLVAGEGGPDLGLFVVPGVGPGPHPAIVFVHGGGWNTRRLHPTGSEFLRGLSDRGFTVIIPEYRTLPSRFPAGVEDIRCALGYVREHAESLGIDAGRVSLWGQSSGAQMTALLLLNPPAEAHCGKGPPAPVASAVLVAGVYDPVGLLQAVSPRQRTLAADLGEWLAETPAIAASPLARAKRIGVPLLLVHGERDAIAPIEQADHFYEKMRSVGNEIELLKVGPAGHDVPSYLWNEQAVERNGLPEQRDRQRRVLGFLSGATRSTPAPDQAADAGLQSSHGRGPSDAQRM